MTTPEAPDPRKVAEAALDMFVYAPMGLALEAKELLPKLAERGRNQVVLARLGARFAMQRAEAEVDKLIERLQPHDDEPAATPTQPPMPGVPPSPAAVVVGPVVAETAPPTSTPAPPIVPPTARAARKRASTPGAGRTTSASAARKPVAAKATAPKRAAAKPTAPKRAAAKPTAPAAAEPEGPAALAVPGYDTLSASQVVPRLDALRPAELEAIRRHEVANRGRRTILSRIAQLQG